MRDSRGLGRADEGRCQVVFNQLDELVQIGLLLQFQRRAKTTGLVQGVLVKRLGGGYAVEAFKKLALSTGKVGISSRYVTGLPPRAG